MPKARAPQMRKFSGDAGVALEQQHAELGQHREERDEVCEVAAEAGRGQREAHHL